MQMKWELARHWLVPALAGVGLIAIDAAAQVPPPAPIFAPPEPPPPPPPRRDPNDKSSSTTPTGSPALWISNDDYPARAMREEREGTTGFRLTIDAAGLPTGCEIIASSGHSDLDAATCNVVRERARFVPGRDRKGRPIGGTYSNRVRWQIPGLDRDEYRAAGFVVGSEWMTKGLPRGALPESRMMMLDALEHYPAAARAAREQGLVKMGLDIDTSGAVADCTITGSSGSAALDEAACALMRSEGRFLPALDLDGKPTRGLFSAKWNWVLPPEATTSAETDESMAPRPFPMNEPGSMTVSLLVNRDGSVSDCQTSSSGFMEKAQGRFTPCTDFGEPKRYQPFVDANGKPVARRVTFRTELSIVDEDAASEIRSGDGP